MYIRQISLLRLNSFHVLSVISFLFNNSFLYCVTRSVFLAYLLSAEPFDYTKKNGEKFANISLLGTF